MTSMYIDGEIYLADGGVVERFVGGQLRRLVARARPATTCSARRREYTLIDSPDPRRQGTLYVYDAANARVVAFDKLTGTYLAQYRPAAGSRLVRPAGLLRPAALARPGPRDLLDRRNDARHRDPPAGARGRLRAARPVGSPGAGASASPAPRRTPGATPSRRRRPPPNLALPRPAARPGTARRFHGDTAPGGGIIRRMVERLIEMFVESVRVHMLSSQHVVILKEMRSRPLPADLDRAVGGERDRHAAPGPSPERPLTHDLLRDRPRRARGDGPRGDHRGPRRRDVPRPARCSRPAGTADRGRLPTVRRARPGRSDGRPDLRRGGGPGPGRRRARPGPDGGELGGGADRRVQARGLPRLRQLARRRARRAREGRAGERTAPASERRPAGRRARRAQPTIGSPRPHAPARRPAHSRRRSLQKSRDRAPDHRRLRARSASRPSAGSGGTPTSTTCRPAAGA